MPDLGIDDIAPSLTPAEKTATLRQVLQSRSGVYHAAAAESDGMARTRPERGSHAPGTYYYYNNWDFNVAGRAFEQVSGARIYDAFDARIARPLGMLDYRNRIVPPPGQGESADASADGYYQLESERSRFPAYHFRMSAHDLGRSTAADSSRSSTPRRRKVRVAASAQKAANTAMSAAALGLHARIAKPLDLTGSTTRLVVDRLRSRGVVVAKLKSFRGGFEGRWVTARSHACL